MKNRLKTSFILTFIFCTFLSCNTEKLAIKSDFVIGTICTIKIPKSKKADKILNLCFEELKRLESILSANSNISELAKVNNKASTKPIKLSDELFELISLSKKISEQTDGAFNPAIGRIVKLWNIGFENERVPKKDEIEKFLPFTKTENLLLNSQKEIFLQNGNVQIDLGAIAKGYACDKIYSLLKDQGVKSAVIDFGGNIFVLGKKFFTKQNWNVGVRNPNGKVNDVLITLELADTSVVTSGIYERFFFEGGIRYHHILDPKTGYPAQNDLASVSVICKNSTYADALATAFSVLGYKKSLEVLKRFSEQKIQVVFIFKDGNVKLSKK